jgi:hypothetical protein
LPIFTRQDSFGLIGRSSEPVEERKGFVTSGKKRHAAATRGCHNKEDDVFAQVAHRKWIRK